MLDSQNKGQYRVLFYANTWCGKHIINFGRMSSVSVYSYHIGIILLKQRYFRFSFGKWNDMPKVTKKNEGFPLNYIPSVLILKVILMSLLKQERR